MLAPSAQDLGDVAFEELIVILAVFGRAVQGIGQLHDHGWPAITALRIALGPVLRAAAPAGSAAPDACPDGQQAHHSEDTRRANGAPRPALNGRPAAVLHRHSILPAGESPGTPRALGRGRGSVQFARLFKGARATQFIFPQRQMGGPLFRNPTRFVLKIALKKNLENTKIQKNH